MCDRKIAYVFDTGIGLLFSDLLNSILNNLNVMRIFRALLHKFYDRPKVEVFESNLANNHRLSLLDAVLFECNQLKMDSFYFWNQSF